MYHSKDEKPIKTITKIRNCLAEISLVPTEQWHNYIDGLYSLRLTFPGITSNIGVNGKGVSKELALASAYGELMERLQNQLLYPLFMYYDFDKELREYLGFEIDPNEKSFTTNQIVKDFPAEIVENLTDDINTFIKSFHGNENKISICLPYYHYNSEKIIYFPRDSFFYYYGSNGMAAGNTLEEAIVQALSEIFERHVMKLALYSNETFPTIPDKILKTIFPSEDEIINEIEAATDFRIRVLDCTMGSRFPVIGIIVSNKLTHKHFVRFGAHPDLHVALERCLTELLQGRDIQELDNMIDFKFFADTEKKEDSINFHNIFRDGWGYYPNSFFFNDSRYAISADFLSKRYSSNKESLRALLTIIETENWQLMIRDVGFLDFPAVSVIIPGISEVSNIDEENVYSLNAARETALALRNIVNLSEKEKEKIIAMAKYHGVMQINPDLIKLVNLPISRDHPYAMINTSLIAAIIYRSLNDHENTIICIDDYMDKTKGELSASAVTYFRCARNFMILLQSGKSSSEGRAILSDFFEDEIVDKVIKEFSSPDYLLKELGVMRCPECSSCSVRNSCSYEVIRQLHRKLKHKMSDNPISQDAVAKVFLN